MEEKHEQLENFRGQIDRVDEEIMVLLKRRHQIVKKVAKYKLENNLEIFQKKREDELIKNKLEKAKLMNIDKKLVENIFKNILEDSKNVQEEVIKKHKEKINN